MAWFWVTEHNSPQGSWKLRLVRPGVVPATPLAGDPGTQADAAQAEAAELSLIGSDGSPAAHDDF